jgi:hypothetical protein
MRIDSRLFITVITGFALSQTEFVVAQNRGPAQPQPAATRKGNAPAANPASPRTGTRPDAVQQAQESQSPALKRPEQKKSQHDESKRFTAPNAPSVSSALKDQPSDGDITGFDFYRDPLNADKPMKPLKKSMNRTWARSRT